MRPVPKPVNSCSFGAGLRGESIRRALMVITHACRCATTRGTGRPLWSILTVTPDSHPLEGLARLLLSLARKPGREREEALAIARAHGAPVLLVMSPPWQDATPYVVLESDSSAAEREAEGTVRVAP